MHTYQKCKKNSNNPINLRCLGCHNAVTLDIMLMQATYNLRPALSFQYKVLHEFPILKLSYYCPYSSDNQCHSNCCYLYMYRKSLQFNKEWVISEQSQSGERGMQLLRQFKIDQRPTHRIFSMLQCASLHYYFNYVKQTDCILYFF